MSDAHDIDMASGRLGRSARDIAMPSPRHRILKPGRNCWRVARARRAAVLVDGADYFARLEASLLNARRSIIIIGWDFDGSIRLHPGAPKPLGPFLRSLLEGRPGLEIRILVWSIAVLHAPGAPVPLVLGAGWQDHPRLHLKLDTRHPIYAAHHQKIVCIDDTVAFVGGMDLTVERWDTRRHAVPDPARITDDGKVYDPVHDIQMVVDGQAAHSVAELARARWKVATGEALSPVPRHDSDPWPRDLRPDFADVRVGIARTYPAWSGQPSIREAATLTADALAAAKRTIYIEAQYMAAEFVGDVLAEHLANPDGPEVVVVTTLQSHGFVEQFVMGNNRDRLIRRLSRADHHDRLRIYYPAVKKPDGSDCQIVIHSKLIAVDDTFLRIGSSNLNNRSIGLDTECDLAIEGADGRTRQTITDLRNGLLAEHLDSTPDLVSRTVAREGGSLVRAIEHLNGPGRGLRAFGPISGRGPTRPAVGTWLLDPREPFEPLWFLHRQQ